ncbi:arginase family-domain-containing protein [Russula earlei]|uniref:Arginase family-domain-containing protein n=1 Tax=Russula earlei TaxID=71964 RepID=A0ACC0UAD8_9AGAM|nr:arginase family-domain-containing protein [Russula earlei]
MKAVLATVWLLSLRSLLSAADQQQTQFTDPTLTGDASDEPAPSSQRRDPSGTWRERYGRQDDLVFTGPLAFSHLPYSRCLEEDDLPAFDVALLGMPFDTTVTYRPGARFRAHGHSHREPSHRLARVGLKMVDCGDVPVSPFNNTLALDQMEVAYSTLLWRDVPDPDRERTVGSTRPFAKDDREHPKIVSLGGDHTIVLPILRSLNKVYGPISVIHFDAHLDTWGPWSRDEPITHGSFFHIAREEGLLSNASVHAGIRCKMTSEADLIKDESYVGFKVISTDDIDDVGISEVIRRIRERVGANPVYLSLDIDVIDPGLAPATGTPEPGGWTTREVKRIIRGLAGLNFVGADVVEVAPAYDHADITSIAAADIVYDFLSLFVSAEPPKPRRERTLRDEL